MTWPRGKVLGGSSAINGMYLVRPSEVEVNAWQSLIAPDDKAAADAWSWTSLLAAMQRSETFTPPSDAIKAQAGIQYDAAAHGTNGPLHVSYPG
jgi:choline dehydrogenase